MYILGLLLFAINTIYATPILHSHFAKLFLEKHGETFSDGDVSAFYLGVFYPDLHYLQVISRETTHQAEDTLEGVLQAPSPFEAGVRLHCFVDKIRDVHIERSSILGQLEGFPKESAGLFLKLIEDEILFDSIDRDDLAKRVEEIVDGEYRDGLPYHSLYTWHKVLSQYLSNSPSAFLRKLRQFNLGMFGISAGEIALWSRSIHKITTSEEFHAYVHSLIDAYQAEL